MHSIYTVAPLNATCDLNAKIYAKSRDHCDYCCPHYCYHSRARENPRRIVRATNEVILANALILIPISSLSSTQYTFIVLAGASIQWDAQRAPDCYGTRKAREKSSNA